MQELQVVKQDSTIRVMFVTRNAAGSAIAPSAAFTSADVNIYKDGGATQRASAAGITVTSPFDAVTGQHLIEIDLSDNTDAGFYAAGSDYVLSFQPTATVDGQTIVEILASWTIETDETRNVRESYLAGVCSGTPTASASDTDLTGYLNDELIGRTVVFTSGTAAGQSTRIYDYAATNGRISYTQLITAPVSGDRFIIF